MTNRVEDILNAIQNHKAIAYLIAGLVVIGALAILVINVTDAGLRIYGIFGEKPNAQAKNEAPPDEKPCGFDINDPDLINVRIYDLKNDIGTTLEIGACPEEPCFIINYEGINMMANPPEAEISIGGHLGGLHLADGTIFVTIILKKGKGLKVFGQYFDLIFEIQDDHVDFIRAWGAIKKGTGETKSSMHFIRYECGD
jgi:hypothetical protein